MVKHHIIYSLLIQSLKTNVQFSKIRRPAERVQGQGALALLSLRLPLLLQMPAGQIQAAVNLIKPRFTSGSRKAQEITRFTQISEEGFIPKDVK